MTKQNTALTLLATFWLIVAIILGYKVFVADKAATPAASEPTTSVQSTLPVASPPSYPQPLKEQVQETTNPQL